jgi:molecular chaperone HscB
VSAAGPGSARHESRGIPERCARCGSGLVTPVYCFACEQIQPFSAVPDYFRLFGLPRAYEIDRAALDAAYRKLSFALHPDLQAASAPEAKRRSERLSADINEGYRILSSESARAAYLLRLLAGSARLDTRRLPPGFLQEMFRLQERIDELGADGPESERRAIRDDVEARMHAAVAERARLFQEALARPEHDEDPEPFQAIQSNLNQETYLQRLLERLNGEGEPS